MLWITLACLGGSETPFDGDTGGGLEPLSDNTATAPAATSDHDHPETLSYVTGEEDDYAWAHAIGYVHADSRTVWDAFQDEDVVTDRGNVDTWSKELTEDEAYDESFLIHCLVDDLIEVAWDVGWYQTLNAGTDSAPEQVVGRVQKIEGSEFIELIEGSVVLNRIDEAVTEVQLIYHVGSLAGAGDDPQAVEDWVTSVHADVVAWSHGNPLPPVGEE